MTTEQLIAELTKYTTKYSSDLARNQDRKTLAEDRTILASLNSRLGELIAEERKVLRDKKYARKISVNLRYKQYRTDKYAIADASKFSEGDYSEEEKEIDGLIYYVQRLELLQSSIKDLLDSLASHLRVLERDFITKNY